MSQRTGLYRKNGLVAYLYSWFVAYVLCKGICCLARYACICVCESERESLCTVFANFQSKPHKNVITLR